MVYLKTSTRYVYKAYFEISEKPSPYTLHFHERRGKIILAEEYAKYRVSFGFFTLNLH